MASIIFNKWMGGVDVRRSELTTSSSALLSLQDGIVNEGAEIENRYAFTNVSAAAANTFGLEITNTGLLTFGSISDPSGWTTPVSYQQLKHPAVYLGGTFNATYHAMTAVTCSTSFGGQAWVSATFSDGNTYTYFNAIPIYSFYAGTVLHALEAVASLSSILSTNIDAVTGFNISTITTSGGVSYFDFWSDVGLSYAANISDPSDVVVTSGGGYVRTVTSGSGILTLQQTFNSVAAVAGVQAVGSFWITGGSTAGSGQVTTIKVNSVVVTSAAVPFNTSNVQTANDIATNINNFISNPKYIASIYTPDNLVAQVIITSTVNGTTPNGYVIEIDLSGDLTVDNTAIDFSKGSPSSGATCTNITPAGGSNIISGGPPTLSGTNYSAWATAIAANIQAFHATSGYTAFANGNVVWISKLTRLSSDSIPATVAVTTSSGTPTDVHNANVTTSVALNVLLATPNVISFNSRHTTSAISLNISGGTPPYTYLWIIASSTGTAFKINSLTTASTTCSGSGPTGTGTIFCQVTDANSKSANSPIVTITN